MPPPNLLSGDLHLSPRVPLRPISPPASSPLRFRHNSFLPGGTILAGARFRRALVVSQKLDADRGGGEDFITRVLKDNPSQVEPKFLVGDRFVTLGEKQRSQKSWDLGLIDAVRRLRELGLRKAGDEGGSDGKGGEGPSEVYLNDILREFKGKLYVPEEVFRESLSEEEEFEKNLRELPVMGVEDFQKHMRANKVKLLTSKSTVGGSPEFGFRGFVVDLKEIPGDKNIQKTKW